MGQEQIERIEAEVQRIEKEIALLKKRREAVLMSDEEYASYVEHYQAYYDDEPLPIRAYYQKMAELEAINALFNQSDVDYEALWQQNGQRIAELERMLAA